MGGHRILDKTFRSLGSVGTGEWMRIGVGTPTGKRNHAQQLAGTNAIGTIPTIGLSMVGASDGEKEVVVRLIGVAPAKVDVTFGTILQGHYAWPASKGRSKFSSRPQGTVPNVIGGQVVFAEGGGSAGGFVDVLIRPFTL